MRAGPALLIVAAGVLFWQRVARAGLVGQGSAPALPAPAPWLPWPLPTSEPGPMDPTPPARTWTPPAAAGPYLAWIRAQEDRWGMPRDLLTRLLYQESRFRSDIINGQVRSRPGATGIAQVMPATARDPGFGVKPLANALDPTDSIRFAGEYLAAMHRRFNSWRLALAAYNWGPGYVATRPDSAWPAETRQYVAQISTDVAIA